MRQSDAVCPGCPFDAAARAAARNAATLRQVADALNCALLSDCHSRRHCEEKVFQLLDGIGEDRREQAA